MTNNDFRNLASQSSGAAKGMIFAALILPLGMTPVAALANGIQMLPPVTEATKLTASPTPCPAVGTPPVSNILTWDGADPISCATGVTVANGVLELSSAFSTMAHFQSTESTSYIEVTGSGGNVWFGAVDADAWILHGDGAQLLVKNQSGSLGTLITGQVGIGTTSPLGVLEAKSTANKVTAIVASVLGNNSIGVYANAPGSGSTGVYGYAPDSEGVGTFGGGGRMGVEGVSSPPSGSSAGGIGVYGNAKGGDGGEGVRGVITDDGTNGVGVYGYAPDSKGVGTFGGGGYMGVEGVSSATSGGTGVYSILSDKDNATGSAVYASNMNCHVSLATGTYGISGNCSNSYVSDERLKKDIAPVENGLETIMKLKPVSFLWKMDTKNHVLITDNDGKEKAKNYGFIAQDVEKVLPELVTRIPHVDRTGIHRDGNPLTQNEEQKNEPKDGYMSLEYTGLISPLVKAVQELYGKWLADHDALAALKADNDNLRSLVSAQGREIEKLEDPKNLR